MHSLLLLLMKRIRITDSGVRVWCFGAKLERVLEKMSSQRMTRRGLLAIGVAGAGSLLLAGCGAVAVIAT